MTVLIHEIEQTYHIYRTHKHVRVAYNPTWVFQHGFKGLWFIGYEDELAYDSVEASGVNAISIRNVVIISIISRLPLIDLLRDSV